jgi:UDP-glucose 4-epimerase
MRLLVSGGAGYIGSGVAAHLLHFAASSQAADGGWLDERHSPETHLIQNVLAAAAGRRDLQAMITDAWRARQGRSSTCGSE